MSDSPRFDSLSIERTTLVDKVYETILEAILSGRLKAGQELSVLRLAKELDVSRTPVHDALLQLAHSGLVDQEVNRRARVASFTRDDVFEIFEMRKLLEGAAVEMAAKQIDKKVLLGLRSTADALTDSMGAVDWVNQWVDFDDEFHNTIAKASGNSRLSSDIGRYRLLHRGFNHLSTNAEVLKSALAEHIDILDQLDSGDAQGAASAMVSHIESWQVFFVKNFPR